MGMLIHRHLIEQNKTALEDAAEKAAKPVKPDCEPKADDSTVTEKKPVKAAKKPVKRATARRTSK